MMPVARACFAIAFLVALGWVSAAHAQFEILPADENTYVVHADVRNLQCVQNIGGADECAVPDPTTDEGLTRLRDNAAQLENELGDPTSQLRTFLTKALNGGLRTDIVKLRDGVGQLDSGAQRLSKGLVQLTDGGRQLAVGASKLAGGTGQLRMSSEQAFRCFETSPISQLAAAFASAPAATSAS